MDIGSEISSMCLGRKKKLPKAEVLNSFAPVISPAKVRQNYLILITEFDLQSGTIYGNEVYSFGE